MQLSSFYWDKNGDIHITFSWSCVWQFKGDYKVNQEDNGKMDG